MSKPGRVKLALHTGKNLGPAGSDLPMWTALNYKCYWKQGIIIIVTDLQFSLIKTHLMPVSCNVCALSYTLASSVGFNSFCCLAAIFLSGRTAVDYQQKINKRKSSIISYLFCHNCNKSSFFFSPPLPTGQFAKRKKTSLWFTVALLVVSVFILTIGLAATTRTENVTVGGYYPGIVVSKNPILEY